uniref:NADH-ubiquinone oxidoreductase chain 3 n=1 Tax=Dibothriocephalus latus TaxID=60516 RepID=Q52QY6_DIBLA|nr:NADH dehydrogenase subunit 3 [Dibothriocephalus latus]AAX85432.1 NADH dehydrogenase subunit 3 [Dibothriocephalus latus]AAX85433.1 NADH dehydrogenase subunit 3 [Dibothriocephalus latus]ABI53739.1 NADH dehydrogenase subunit 3 [Dibothriocephalus latus]USC32160.1 NADH dehydrogenase subunit 3 [Dibothriocephalus latus]USC32161.1 NADH dehydrogenase subunit 3 [Dibothriocephalus latus]
MLALFFGGFIFLLLFAMIGFFTSGVFNKIGFSSISWGSPYECGFSSSSLSFNCFSFTYFSLLVFFVVFDLEISLLLNMPENGLLFGNFIYYFLFLIILSLGFVSEVLWGYVRWGYWKN